MPVPITRLEVRPGRRLGWGCPGYYTVLLLHKFWTEHLVCSKIKISCIINLPKHTKNNSFYYNIDETTHVNSIIIEIFILFIPLINLLGIVHTLLRIAHSKQYVA